MASNHSQTQPLFTLRVREDLPGLLSLLAFLIITAFLFRSWEFALLVTASLGFHELGHALALAWYRLDFRVSFGVVGAYTWSRLSQRVALSHMSNSVVHLAGPFFSLLLALIALTLHLLWQSDSRHLLILANFSAQVGFLNLLPLGDLTDGGKVLQRIALSALRRRVRAVVVLLSALALVGPLLAAGWKLIQVGPSGVPAAAAGAALIGIWLTISLMMNMRHTNPPPRTAPLLMNVRQVSFLVLVMWDMLAALMLVIMATPFWLEPHYVLGSLQNIEAVMQWLFQVN